MEQRNCRVCGVLFTPKQARSGVCSMPCFRKEWRQRERDGGYGDCAEPGCDRGVRARGLCVTHYNATHHPDSHELWPRGRDATARSRQNRNHRRRALLKAEDCEVVDRNKVGDRDGWRCGICRLKVDRDLAYPHPRSPSLDHVIPLSLQGPHTYANTRIAHLKCNTDRSNRLGVEQLALIG